MKMGILAVHSPDPTVEDSAAHSPGHPAPSSDRGLETPSAARMSESLENALELRKQRREMRQAERNQRRLSLLSGTPSPPGSPDRIAQLLSRSNPIGPKPACRGVSTHQPPMVRRSREINQSNGGEQLRQPRALFPKSVSIPTSTCVGSQSDRRAAYHPPLWGGAQPHPNFNSSSAPSSPTPSQRAPSRLGRSLYGISTPTSPGSPSPPWGGAQAGLREQSQMWDSPSNTSPRFPSPLGKSRVGPHALSQSTVLPGSTSSTSTVSSSSSSEDSSRVAWSTEPLEGDDGSLASLATVEAKLTGPVSTSAHDECSPSQHVASVEGRGMDQGMLQSGLCDKAQGSWHLLQQQRTAVLEFRRSGSALSLADLAREFMKLERTASACEDDSGAADAPLLRPELRRLILQMDGLDRSSHGSHDSTASTPSESGSRTPGAAHRRGSSVDAVAALQIAQPTLEDGWTKNGRPWKRRGGAGQEKWNSGIWISAVKKRIEKIEREEREKRAARVFAELQAAQERVRRRSPDWPVKVQIGQKEGETETPLERRGLSPSVDGAGVQGEPNALVRALQRSSSGTMQRTGVRALGFDVGDRECTEGEKDLERLPRPSFSD